MPELAIPWFPSQADQDLSAYANTHGVASLGTIFSTGQKPVGGFGRMLEQTGSLHLGLDLLGGLEVRGDDLGVLGRVLLKSGIGGAGRKGVEHGQDFRVPGDHGGDVGLVECRTLQRRELDKDGLMFRVQRGGDDDFLRGGQFGQFLVQRGMALDHVSAEFLHAWEAGIRLGDLSELNLEDVHRGYRVGKFRRGHRWRGGNSGTAGHGRSRMDRRE